MWNMTGKSLLCAFVLFLALFLALKFYMERQTVSGEPAQDIPSAVEQDVLLWKPPVRVKVEYDW